MGEKSEFSNAEYYTGREYSWLLFNKRVLSEARDKQIPLFERLKFLSITASNLDEFFMVRVASLKDMTGYRIKDIAGMTPEEQLIITVDTAVDITLEKGLFAKRADFFEEVYSVKPVIRQKKPELKS